MSHEINETVGDVHLALIVSDESPTVVLHHRKQIRLGESTRSNPGRQLLVPNAVMSYRASLQQTLSLHDPFTNLEGVGHSSWPSWR